MGILLLRGFAAVAEVPRPDDVGVDAFATLLRKDEEDGHFYAEDGFVVQIKSASVPKLEYEGHALKWLLEQAHPMFIGLVSLQESTIAIYPTWAVNQAVFAMHAESATIHFKPSGIPEFFRGVPTLWRGKAGNAVDVYLDSPLLQWSVTDLTRPGWGAEAYRVLKRYSEEHRRAANALMFGESRAILWDTNDPDSIRSAFTMSKGPPDDMAAVAERLRPAVQSLLMRTFSMKDDEKPHVIVSLIVLAEGLRKIGLDIDPERYISRFGPSLLPYANRPDVTAAVYEFAFRFTRDADPNSPPPHGVPV